MKISEVSKKYNITIDTLRYYEKIGLLPSIQKNSSGIRIYSREDCKKIEFIICMRSAGLSIEVLKKYLELCKLGDKTAKIYLGAFGRDPRTQNDLILEVK